jgi:hypothetical protein
MKDKFLWLFVDSLKKKKKKSFSKSLSHHWAHLREVLFALLGLTQLSKLRAFMLHK